MSEELTEPKPAKDRPGRSRRLSLDTNIRVLLASSVFAAAGWFISYLVDTHMSVPTIEYFLDTSTSNVAKATIHNLSRDVKFRNLTFVLHLNPPKNVQASCSGFREEPQPSVISKSPAFGPDRHPISNPYSVVLKIGGLHPDSEIDLVAYYDCEELPTLNLTEDSEAVRLLRDGVSTWIIRNELEILAALLSLWVIVVIYTLSSSRGGRNEHETS